MVLYNRSLAEYASASGLPCIYRNIAQYEESGMRILIIITGFLSTEADFILELAQKPIYIVSSPIRRVTDIINQVQFEALLNKQEPPFSAEELSKLIPAIEEEFYIYILWLLVVNYTGFLAFFRENIFSNPLMPSLSVL